MARKLKTYQTSVGFFDLAVAAPSMKAAAEAWGLKTSEFKRGFAKEGHDPAIIAATMAKPGIVLRRRSDRMALHRTRQAAERLARGKGQSSKASERTA
jgi:colicin import membrane protein